jgi:23S rRNA pseudouridine1911/1915/1917 synthase
MKRHFDHKPHEQVSITVPIDTVSMRLDQFLTSVYDQSSRSFFQNLIKNGCVAVNNKPAKVSMMVREGDVIVIHVPGAPERDVSDKVLDHLEVAVINENPHFLVISKPAGLVVHQPHKNSAEVTLVDWLTHFYKGIESVGESDRPGIVHRLDKDTSGIMLIARTPYGLATLSDMFKNRTIQKTYLALVEGRPPKAGIIDLRIDRHPVDPTKMACHTGSGRDAKTHYTTLETYHLHALLELKPVTGRTHQIRVHCAGIDHPLLGDAVYGSSSKLIGRHALHAAKISFTFEGKLYDFQADLPQDFVNARDMLKVSKS